MLRIAICDDEIDARDALRIQLEKLLIEDSEEIVYEFSSGTNAASWFFKHPGEIDLLFLDVEMKGLNGMETAEKIRTFDNQLLIVFVTGYSDYVFDGYRVGALDYLMKPATEESLRQLLGRVRAKAAREEARTYTIKTIDGTWRFHLSDILYFYSDKRKVNLVTSRGQYTFYARLDETEAQLSPHFVRIHQRYLINPAHVDYLNSESVTIHGQKLPCSRKYRESASRKVARAMMGGDFTWQSY
ncbi:MAG: response regulator transcription factor [Lachnospiraceae bacterium]|jgi:DNA-binding LytR/AlgR family response regulator|nr:response regulator transcription factor [Lachnospiraceae bacterium]